MLERCELAGRRVPPLVTQIADGENGGVMMNEFPPKYLEVVRECSGSRTPMLNATEYLERVFATGVTESDLPVIQPLFQHRICERTSPGDGPDRLADVIEALRREDGRFHTEGGSWTNDVSWVHGYDGRCGCRRCRMFPHVAEVADQRRRAQVFPARGDQRLMRVQRDRVAHAEVTELGPPRYRISAGGAARRPPSASGSGSRQSPGRDARRSPGRSRVETGRSWP